jgi:hypothetical protein
MSNEPPKKASIMGVYVQPAFLSFHQHVDRDKISFKNLDHRQMSINEAQLASLNGMDLCPMLYDQACSLVNAQWRRDQKFHQRQFSFKDIQLTSPSTVLPSLSIS